MNAPDDSRSRYGTKEEYELPDRTIDNKHIIKNELVRIKRDKVELLLLP